MDMCSGQAPLQDQDKRLLIVGGLSRKTTKADLWQVFLKFGPLTDARVCRTTQGKSKHFGRVQFANHFDAKRALCNSRQLIIRTKLVSLKLVSIEENSQEERSLRAQKSLVLKFIPAIATKEIIRRQLKPFGPLQNLSELRHTDDGTLLCFVTFENVQDAEHLLGCGSLIFDGGFRVIVEKFSKGSYMPVVDQAKIVQNSLHFACNLQSNHTFVPSGQSTTSDLGMAQQSSLGEIGDRLQGEGGNQVECRNNNLEMQPSLVTFSPVITSNNQVNIQNPRIAQLARGSVPRQCSVKIPRWRFDNIQQAQDPTNLVFNIRFGHRILRFVHQGLGF